MSEPRFEGILRSVVCFVSPKEPKMVQKMIFMWKYLHISKKSSTFAAQKFKNRIMEATVRQPIVPNKGTISDEKWGSLHTIDELDASLKSIIREAQLIDPDWKEQPMRPWSEVYDELCAEVGHAYGLNDIREA